MRDFWEDRYKNEDYIYGVDPNIFFKTFIEGVQPGRILLPAEGKGRNAVYAANRGWEVNAFDFSLNARRKALELARIVGGNVNHFVADIEFHELEEEMYDVIALINVHFPLRNRTYIHRKLINSLKKGGFFMIEAFSKNHHNFDPGEQLNMEMFYEIADLQFDFKDTDIETLYRVEIDAGESTVHEGKASLIRMLAIKR